MLFWILLFSFAETLIALSGQIVAYLLSDKIKRYIPYFISFAVGTILAVVFLNILPDASKMMDVDALFIYTLGGFLFFFLLSRSIFWYHCHTSTCTVHDRKSGVLVLFGDAIHNFIDGAIIALSFLVDFRLGVATSVAVLAHELPMEISDFFILINSGYTKRKALFYNFLIALTTPLGAVIVYYSTADINSLIGPALGIVAGNFLYIAASDLLPELHNNSGDSVRESFIQSILIIFGVLVIYFLGTI